MLMLSWTMTGFVYTKSFVSVRAAWTAYHAKYNNASFDSIRFTHILLFKFNTWISGLNRRTVIIADTFFPFCVRPVRGYTRVLLYVNQLSNANFNRDGRKLALAFNISFLRISLTSLALCMGCPSNCMCELPIALGDILHLCDLNRTGRHVIISSSIVAHSFTNTI